MTAEYLACASPNAAAAELWTAAGLYVFPCCPQTKRPRRKGWQEVERDGRDWLREWRAGVGGMPGLGCAHAGIVVIDCDLREDHSGEKEFRALCSQLGVDLNSVPSVTTPSGGRHFYFKQPTDLPVRNSAGQLAAGVDVRGQGGYVIAAGSQREDGREYLANDPSGLQAFIRRVATGDLPQLPSQLLSLLVQTTPPPMAFGYPGASAAELANSDLSAGIKLPWRLTNAANRVATAPLGMRNDSLNREGFTAGLLVGNRRLDPQLAHDTLRVAGRLAGLLDDEVDRTLAAAIQRGVETASAQSDALHRAPTWDRTSSGQLKSSLNNAILALRRLGAEAKRDTFANVVILGNAPGACVLPLDHCGPYTDNSLLVLRKVILDTFNFDAGREHLHDAIRALAEEGRYDPVQVWLDSQSWDGVRRIGNWLPRIAGTPDSPLFRRAGACLILAMVMRARFPASKYDACFVLEGPQGSGKSSLVRLLASGPGEGYFADAPGLMAMDNKTRAEIIGGKWLVELCELSGMARSETEAVKAFITQTSDQYRPPYARTAEDRPRRCVFVATTNAVTYLPDSTGNRRFLPVPCGRIDLAELAKERAQLFAEADAVVTRLTRSAMASGRVQRSHALPRELSARFALPAGLWPEAGVLADDRRVVDPVEEALPGVVAELERAATDHLPDGRLFVRSAELLARLRIHLGRDVRNHGLAGWMKTLGWQQAKLDRWTRGYAR